MFLKCALFTKAKLSHTLQSWKRNHASNRLNEFEFELCPVKVRKQGDAGDCVTGLKKPSLAVKAALSGGVSPLTPHLLIFYRTVPSLDRPAQLPAPVPSVSLSHPRQATMRRPPLTMAAAPPQIQGRTKSGQQVSLQPETN